MLKRKADGPSPLFLGVLVYDADNFRWMEPSNNFLLQPEPVNVLSCFLSSVKTVRFDVVGFGFVIFSSDDDLKLWHAKILPEVATPPSRNLRCPLPVPDQEEKKVGYRAWIRTMNNASKGRCVTVTPRGKSEDETVKAKPVIRKGNVGVRWRGTSEEPCPSDRSLRDGFRFAIYSRQ